jgi:diaminopimelate epimerase
MEFTKYHALGNDYLVIEPSQIIGELSKKQIETICHRNFGVGSDGILLGPIKSDKGEFGLRIFNPDGSEAEKSGNGIRIFSRYLWDRRLVGEDPFSIQTLGGEVSSRVHSGGRRVDVEMGRVSFDSSVIPVVGPQREVINEEISVDGTTFRFCAATIGNPHCVILRDEISEDEARRFGPFIETDSRFPNKTNVQFMKVLDRNAIQIEIWERGAGYTLASGSSSSASAAVAHRLGLCDEKIAVHMPGGRIDISVSPEFDINMSGPVCRVAEGVIDPEVFSGH